MKGLVAGLSSGQKLVLAKLSAWALIIFFLIILLLMTVVNTVDNRKIRKKERAESYHTELTEEGYQRKEIMVSGSFNKENGPNLTFSPGANFKFSFDRVVKVHDRNGNYLGEVGPNKKLDIGKNSDNIALYVWSPKGPWKDDIYVCYRGCK